MVNIIVLLVAALAVMLAVSVAAARRKARIHGRRFAGDSRDARPAGADDGYRPPVHADVAV